MAYSNNYFFVRSDTKNVLDVLYQELIDFCNRYEKIYLFGAGQLGMLYLELLKKKGIIPSAFVVSMPIDEETNNYLLGIPVISLNEMPPPLLLLTVLVL